jgi:hypothetical protein
LAENLRVRRERQLAAGGILFFSLRLLLRALQLLAGFIAGFAAAHGFIPTNEMLIQGGVLVAITSAAAWLVERRLLAGWWATVLGFSATFVYMLSLLGIPECSDPHFADVPGGCVVPGTHLISVVALLVAVVSVVAGAREFRRFPRTPSP